MFSVSVRLLLIALIFWPAMANASAVGASSIQTKTLAPMIEKVIGAVVSIKVRGVEQIEQSALAAHPIFGEYVRNEIGNRPTKEVFTSSGSGVIVNAKDGLILTNHHVVEYAEAIRVYLIDGREFEGKLVGADPATDVAAVKIDAKDLVEMPIGDSTKVRVGDFIVAIGNPLGLEYTATSGMVSAKMRSSVGWREFDSYIQHDASVNSGNSGGALVNLDGRLIGINTVIRQSRGGGSIGLGFAIPINFAQAILKQLVQHGKVRRGQIGVDVADVNAQTRKLFGLEALKGAVIMKVQKGSPAEAADLRIGDVVVGVKAAKESELFPINRSKDIESIILSAEVGTKGILVVNRAGKLSEVATEIIDLKKEPERVVVPNKVMRLAGVVLESLEQDSPLYGLVKGVKVVHVKEGSLPYLVGLLPGDIITAVDDDRVRSPENLLSIVANKSGKFTLHANRDGTPVRVTYPF